MSLQALSEQYERGELTVDELCASIVVGLFCCEMISTRQDMCRRRPMICHQRCLACA